MDAPLEVGAKRTPEGLYDKAMKGVIKNFAGVDGPYEPPERPDIHLATGRLAPLDCVWSCSCRSSCERTTEDARVDSLVLRPAIGTEGQGPCRPYSSSPLRAEIASSPVSDSESRRRCWLVSHSARCRWRRG